MLFWCVIQNTSSAVTRTLARLGKMEANPFPWFLRAKEDIAFYPARIYDITHVESSSKLFLADETWKNVGKPISMKMSRQSFSFVQNSVILSLFVLCVSILWRIGLVFNIAVDPTQCFTVSTSDVAIIEKWGRYSRTANAGCNFLCCPMEQMVGKLSFRWVYWAGVTLGMTMNGDLYNIDSPKPLVGTNINKYLSWMGQTWPDISLSSLLQLWGDAFLKG